MDERRPGIVRDGEAINSVRSCPAIAYGTVADKIWEIIMGIDESAIRDKDDRKMAEQPEM